MSRMKYKDANGEWRYADMALEWENGGGSDTESDLIVDIELNGNPDTTSISDLSIISESIIINKTLAEIVAVATKGILSVSGGYKFISSGYTEWYPFYINSCAVLSAEMINLLVSSMYQVDDQTDTDGISFLAWHNLIANGTVTVQLKKQYIIYHSSNTDELVVLSKFT